MRCSICSCRCLCAWTASILVNLLFVGGIGWSLVRIWPFALGLSSLYIVVLALWIRRFHKPLENDGDSAGEASARNVKSDRKRDEAPSTTGTPSAQQESESQSSEMGEIRCHADQVPPADLTRTLSPKAIPLSLSLLYALFVFSLATPGAILSLKAIPCQRSSYFENEIFRGRSGWTYWTTDTEKLPSAVRSWDESNGNYDYWDINEGGRDMFCQLRDTMYFSGKLPPEGIMTRPTFFAVSGTAPARQVGNFSEPEWLTKVTNTTCCFYGNTVDYNTFNNIFCGNEDDGFDEIPSVDGLVPSLLTGIGGLLLFRGYDTNGDTYAIISLNVTTMETTEYSEKHEESAEIDEASAEGDQASNAYREECNRFSQGQVVGGLFQVALPVTFISIWLWAKKGIPSSSFTLYVGLGLVCGFVFNAIYDPYDYEVGFFLWFYVGTPIWILASAFVLAVNTKAKRRGVLAWGLHSIASFFAILLLLLVVIAVSLQQDSSEGKGWFLLVLAFILLVLVGIVVKSTYLYMLGFLGITVIVSIATLRLSRLGVATSIPLVVLVNLVLVFVGWYIHRKTPKLHEKMVSSLARCVGHTPEEIDAEEDTGLLLNTEATAA